MNVHEQCLFSELAKEDATGVHGNTIVKNCFVGGVLLEVDDHLMGGLGFAHHLSMDRVRGKMKFGNWPGHHSG